MRCKMFELSTPQEILKEFARRVKEERIRQNKTQEIISKRVGIGLATYQRFENSGQIKFESFISILVVLGKVQELSSVLIGPAFSPKALFTTPSKKRQRAKSNIVLKVNNQNNTNSDTYSKILKGIRDKNENR